MAESEDATSGHAARDMAREECIEIHQHFRRTCHVAQCKLGNLGRCNLMTTRRERFGVIPDDRGWGRDRLKSDRTKQTVTASSDWRSARKSDSRM